MYIYRYRPGYGSNELLIEFYKGPEKEAFIPDLLSALEEIKPVITGTHDLWMNDEVMMTVDSAIGRFTLSKDIWDLAFIMADTNQKGLEKIDQLLSKHPDFEKEEVNFDDYKKVNDKEN
ncbi:MAG: hypothetical protein GY810_32025 [Aureispira sp.]|nr:hypothetical protein [Aureispira sp.]